MPHLSRSCATSGLMLPEKTEARARQTEALQQYVFRGVRTLAAHQPTYRLALELATLLAGVRRVVSYLMQALRVPSGLREVGGR